MSKIELFLSIIVICLGGYWFMNPNSNIEPLVVVATGLIPVGIYLNRKYRINGQIPIEEETQAPPEMSNNIGEKAINVKLTVHSIITDIKNAKPFQRDNVAKSYEGQHAKFIGKLCKVEVDWSDKSKYRIKIEIEGKSIVSYVVWIVVDLNGYQFISTMSEGDYLEVIGCIERASYEGLYVTVTPYQMRQVND